MGLFKDIYNQANDLNVNSKIDINDIIHVSFFDVLKEKKVIRKVLQPSDCLCVNPNNLQTYYHKCPKCGGKKEIEIFSRLLTCNACKGLGVVVKEECPVCKGRTKILKKVDFEIKLNKNLLENPLLVIEGKGIDQGNLILKVDIYDKDAYLIKDGDIYSKKILFFNKKEFKQSKEIETSVDFTNIKLDKIVYEQVLVLKGKGLNRKDFYQPVRCEVDGQKGNNIYSNLLLDKIYPGVYVKKEDIYNHHQILTWSLTCPLNDPNYLYLDLQKYNKNYDILSFEEFGDKSFDGGKNGDLFVKIFVGNYFVKDNSLYRTDEVLTKTEISSNKKSIIIGNEKFLVNMDKGKDYNYFLYMGKYGLLNQENKMEGFYTLINHHYSVYRISTFNKNKHFYIQDYKHFFNEVVLSYDNNDNMEEYIEINGNLEVEDKNGNKVIVSLLKKEGL